MQNTELIGYLAASLTTYSFVPQALHTFRTRDVSGISLGMYAAFTVGLGLWLVYGFLLDAWPMVLANSITLALAAAILGMKVLYQVQHPGAAPALAASVLAPPRASEGCAGGDDSA